MQISRRGLDLIKRHEGLRLTAYRCPVGVWTIGYGSTGRQVQQGMTITEEQAEAMLIGKVREFAAAVAEMAGPCSQGQFDALVSFAYNVGIPSLGRSTLMRKHKAGDFEGAAAEFGKWVNGRRVGNLPGLVRRRADERALYQS